MQDKGKVLPSTQAPAPCQVQAVPSGLIHGHCRPYLLYPHLVGVQQARVKRSDQGSALHSPALPLPGCARPPGQGLASRASHPPHLSTLRGLLHLQSTGDLPTWQWPLPGDAPDQYGSGAPLTSSGRPGANLHRGTHGCQRVLPPNAHSPAETTMARLQHGTTCDLEGRT